MSTSRIVLVCILFGAAAGSPDQRLVVSVRASGDGMTWMAAVDYDLQLRQDGTMVYSGLSGSTPVLRIRSVSKARLGELVQQAQKMTSTESNSLQGGFRDCSLKLDVSSVISGKRFVATGVPCDLSGVPNDVLYLVCNLDALRRSSDGGISTSACGRRR
jgi:hypothetical protein